MSEDHAAVLARYGTLLEVHSEALRKVDERLERLTVVTETQARSIDRMITVAKTVGALGGAAWAVTELVLPLIRG